MIFIVLLYSKFNILIYKVIKIVFNEMFYNTNNYKKFNYYPFQTQFDVLKIQFNTSKKV